MAKDKPEKAKKDKTEKAKKKDKAVSNRRPAKKVTADDFEPVACKDFINCRWEITENGQLGIWQPEEDEGERPALSIIPGKITDAVYEKMCGVVSEEEGAKKRTVLQNIILYSSQYNNVFQKINKK